MSFRFRRKPFWHVRRGAKFLAALFLVLPLAACTMDGSLDDVKGATHKSGFIGGNSRDSKVGEREHPVVVAKYGGEYRNAEAEKVLALIVGRLVAASPDKAQIFKITILDTPKVNAFALPGGYLYVTRGLMALANDSAELAAVIAHEMAHVSSAHAILRQQKQADNEVGSRVVSEVLGNSVAAKVAQAANQLRLAEFSQEQELQADAVGIRTLGNAGFDAHGAARFLNTMQAYQSLVSGRGEGLGDVSFMSSHPSTPRRIELARNHARFFGAPGTLPAERDRYLRGIDGLLFGDTAEEGFVRGNRFSHTGLGITFEGPAGSRVENQTTAVVVNGPGDLATRFDAAILPRGDTLETYLKSGWVKGLDEASIRNTSVNGLPAAVAEARGGDWRFVIRIVQLDRQVYRFITAGPLNATSVEAASAEIVNTFRQMSDAEKAALRPLKIRVVTVSPADTLATLAGRMKTGSNKLRWFQVLNGLSPGEIPVAGSKVKIVSE